MSCNFTSNYELAFNITYSLFEAIDDVCPSTYIRPDPVMSLPYQNDNLCGLTSIGR